MILDCRPIARNILDRLKQRKVPTQALAGVLITYDLTSVSFLTQKEKIAKELGITFIRKRFAIGIPQRFIEEEVERLVYDEGVGGIILQLPFPEEYDRDSLVALLPQEKDVDALKGAGKVLPPAVGALIEILEHVNFDLGAARVVMVGKGFLVGQPIAAWLQDKAKKIVVMDRDSFAVSKLRNADLIIGGAGVPGLIHGEDIKAGALCVDFGYGKKDAVLQGDFDIPSVSLKASYLTPVPGGTGPVLVAKLFENFFMLAEQSV